MITIDTTQTPPMPVPASPLSGDDALTHDAGRPGRPSSCKRRHVTLYAMAVEGLRVPKIDDTLVHQVRGMPHITKLRIFRGVEVLNAVELHGANGVKSIEDAVNLRIMLGSLAGRFAGIEHDTLARDGVSFDHIAQIRMGIRHRNGDMRREWC